jgi:hypothetical protein
MTILSAICCCFFKSNIEEDKSNHVVVEAGSLSKKSKEGDIHRSSAPIVVSYFPVNSQPSRL